MSTHRVELDYVAAPRRPWWIGASVLILALAVAGGMVLRYRDVQHELAAVDAAQGLLNADRRPQRAVSKGQLDEEARIIDATVRQLNIPWAQMIEAVETASSSEVTVLQLQPETQQRSLRLTAEAKNREAMLRYVRRLGETRALSGVHLVNHHVQVEDPSRPIQFGVQASFRSIR
jgi:Tfp pilus assembly protein PilN